MPNEKPTQEELDNTISGAAILSAIFSGGASLIVGHFFGEMVGFGLFLLLWAVTFLGLGAIAFSGDRVE